MKKKKQYSKQVAAILSTLAMIGTVHADQGFVTVDGKKEGNKLIIERLIERGVLVKINDENWYEINHDRLNEIASEDAQMAAADARETEREDVYKMLSELVEGNTQVERVHILASAVSSQDFPGLSR